jgi:hypothetical protein
MNLRSGPQAARWKVNGRKVARVVASCACSFAVGVASSLVFAGTAFAAGTNACSEGPGAVNHWRGEAVVGGQKHGTSGTVPGRTLLMCTGPGLVEVDASFYFSNVEPASGSFRDIVQIGFGQGRSPTLTAGMHFESAWGRSTSTSGCSAFSDVDPITHERGSYDSLQHDYKVYHQNNEWDLLVGSTIKSIVAESSICWTPGKSSWFGETWDKGDQLGGTAASHLPVTLMNYAGAEGGGFVWTNLVPGPVCNYNNAVPPAEYQCNITSSTAIGLWTNDR